MFFLRKDDLVLLHPPEGRHGGAGLALRLPAPVLTVSHLATESEALSQTVVWRDPGPRSLYQHFIYRAELSPVTLSSV